LLVEPETVLISVFSRTEDEEWSLDTYSKSTDIIDLPKLRISFTAGEVYEL